MPSASAGAFTGPSMAYVYPDLHTALVGEFKDGTMISAKGARIIDVDTSDSLIWMPKFKMLNTKDSVSYSKSSRTAVCSCPLISDPYESRTVSVRQSLISGAGEGLFAARYLLKGEVAAFYNGVRIPYKLGGPKEEWSTSGYKIFVNADYVSGERMDVPEHLVSLDKYVCLNKNKSKNNSSQIHTRD